MSTIIYGYAVYTPNELSCNLQVLNQASPPETVLDQAISIFPRLGKAGTTLIVVPIKRVIGSQGPGELAWSPCGARTAAVFTMKPALPERVL